jgi:hypothetical protein
MDGSSALSGWGVFALVLPLLGILLMAMFGIDEHVFTSRRHPRVRRSFCEVTGNGESFLSDPDGQPWQTPPVRQIEATLIPAGRPRRKVKPDPARACVIPLYIYDKNKLSNIK